VSYESQDERDYPESPNANVNNNSQNRNRLSNQREYKSPNLSIPFEHVDLNKIHSIGKDNGKEPEFKTQVGMLVGPQEEEKSNSDENT